MECITCQHNLIQTNFINNPVKCDHKMDRADVAVIRARYAPLRDGIARLCESKISMNDLNFYFGSSTVALGYLLMLMNIK